MKVRRLGNSGLKVSVVGLGCNNFGMRIDADQTQAVVDAAIDAGITLFDTADVYGATKSEEFLGKALGKRRHEIVLATKFGMQVGQDPKKRGGSRKWIMQAVEDSLRRLGTDYIDLYQHHSPDPDTPVDETLRALDDLVSQGKVRYLGNSNYSGWQIADADWTAAGQSRFVSAQNLYSLLERDVEREVLPACEHFGLGFLPFFPLASGLLSGKYDLDTTFAADDHRTYNRDGSAFDVGETFSGVDYATGVEAAREFAGLVESSGLSGVTPAQAAIAWAWQQPGVTTVIPGARNVSQAEANAAAGLVGALPDSFLAGVADLYDRRIRAQVHGRW